MSAKNFLLCFCVCLRSAAALSEANVGLTATAKQPRLTETKDDVIQKVAKNADDIWDTYKDVIDGGAEAVGQLIAGKQVDWSALAEKYIVVLLGVIDPLLGAAASILMSFLGGLFGGSSVDIFDEIMKEVKQIIKTSLLQNNLATVHGDLEDLCDDTFWENILANEPSALLSYLVDREGAFNDKKREVFNVDCWDQSYDDSAACRDWVNSGAIFHELNFVHVHLQIFVSYASAAYGDPQTVKSVLTQMHTLGSEYMTKLNDSYLNYFLYRWNDEMHEPDFSQDNINFNAQCGALTIGGYDNFLNEDILTSQSAGCGFVPYPPCSTCGSGDERIISLWYSLCQDHPGAECSECFSSATIVDNTHDRASSCYETYKSNVRSQCLKLQPIIDSMQALVDAADRKSVV